MSAARDMISDLRVNAGFTLVELLIALTLVGLMSVVLFGGLHFGARAWEAGSERAAQLGEIEAVHGFLRRQIGQAVLPAGTGGRAARTASASRRLDPDAATDSFAGEEDSLRFTALVPSRIGVGGFYRFQLSAVQDDAFRRLEVSWWLDRPDESRDEPPEELDNPDETESAVGGKRVLIEGLERVVFRYYGAERGTGDAEWRGDWDGEAGLPALIALEIEFPPNDYRSWPELLVAPKFSVAPPAS